MVAKNCGEGERGTTVYGVPVRDDKKVLERGGGDGCISILLNVTELYMLKTVKMVLCYLKVNTHSEKAQRCKRDKNKAL